MEIQIKKFLVFLFFNQRNSAKIQKLMVDPAKILVTFIAQVSILM